MFFHPLDFLIIIAFGLSLWAQFKVKGNFQKFSKIKASSEMTGAEIARKLLDRNGLYNVSVENVRGALTDHYDPIKKAVRLSDSVYPSNSIAAISVAAHEVGHAIQHSESYGALVVRHKMFPIVNFTSGIAPFLLIGGFLLGSLNLLGLGIVFFSAVVVFQLITLPVEFNASNRARSLMVSEGMIVNTEENGVKKVLNAAALTYVAAALLSLLQLLKFIAIFSQGNRE
ncbi:Zn-dependent membrane protease YugP [Metabacillus crassostreae]|uniref:zinc metallopeptidase n=1 Tax=Metabacillus crassostreae TaxID=929098 RepID=UPI00195B22D3|nr:zinc metallopeptidase [Metabacillus crassostreae]MBM7605470.1 Zn-dependent membrane protease YugP [Metabacillus crassostreae]